MSPSSWFCSNCKKIAANCSLCRFPVKGLYSFCQTCGHGGHALEMRDWWKSSDKRLCPEPTCQHVCGKPSPGWVILSLCRLPTPCEYCLWTFSWQSIVVIFRRGPRQWILGLRDFENKTKKVTSSPEERLSTQGNCRTIESSWWLKLSIKSRVIGQDCYQTYTPLLKKCSFCYLNWNKNY